MKIDFEKSGGLVPAVIQDANTLKVLMLGYMNQEAFDQTMSTGKVTFFSRSKNRLWIKGEESGNFLELKSMALDCDNDSLLIKAIPIGPVCHTGADTCWGEKNHADDFLTYLEGIIELRKHSTDDTSYVKSLFERGLNKIAQKLGEEAVEMIIEAKDDNHELFVNEAADLLFHYLILLNRKGFSLQDIKEVLRKRHSS
jgi:phosphoribosyl-AMP cyclohydrolase / phosphoribosyl-ATP pyrophosphohydrolase